MYCVYAYVYLNVCKKEQLCTPLSVYECLRHNHPTVSSPFASFLYLTLLFALSAPLRLVNVIHTLHLELANMYYEIKSSAV